jgi:hypothetical protein
MSNAFDGIGEGYREPTFRAVTTAFVLIMAAVALVWVLWVNLVSQPGNPASSAPPGVQRVDYPAAPDDKQ